MSRIRRQTMWRIAQEPQDVESVKLAFVRHIQSSLGRDEFVATDFDRYQALCLTARDNTVERWVNTQQTYYQEDAKRVYYISMEFLMGRILHNALCNLELLETYRQALAEMGHNLEELEDLEVDAGLGNGGLGRLAACLLDSMATQQIPGYGYGLRYDYGIFRQDIQDGYQVEEPDDWLRLPHPWELFRPEYLLMVHFAGRVEQVQDEKGQVVYRWVDAALVGGAQGSEHTAQHLQHLARGQLADGEDVHDVRAAGLVDRPGLLDEARHHLLLDRQLRLEHLDRHPLADQRVHSGLDRAHPPP